MMDCSTHILSVVSAPARALGLETAVLEIRWQILDQMARLVHLSIKIARRLAIALGWNYRGLPRRQKGFNHAFIGIEGLISRQGIGFHLRQERVGAFKIMRLASLAHLCCGRSLGLHRLFLGAGTMLVGTHNRTIDHGVFVVRIGCQKLEYLLPDATLRPT